MNCLDMWAGEECEAEGGVYRHIFTNSRAPHHIQTPRKKKYQDHVTKHETRCNIQYTPYSYPISPGID